MKSSYSKVTTRTSFRTHSTLLMDDGAAMGPAVNPTHAAVWDPFTWEELFDEAKRRLLEIHAEETNKNFRNELLREGNIMASGLVCKGSNDHTGDQCVWLRPRSRGPNQLALEVRLLKTGGRLAQRPRDHFSQDEEVYSEVFSTEAQTTGLDIYAFTEKHYVYQMGYMKVRKRPDTPGTRGIDMLQVPPELPAVPWKRNPRNGRQINSLLVVNSMSNPPSGVTGKPHLPFVLHVYNVVREGTAKCPTFLSLHPFPGPGVSQESGKDSYSCLRKGTNLSYRCPHCEEHGQRW